MYCHECDRVLFLLTSGKLKMLEDGERSPLEWIKKSLDHASIHAISPHVSVNLHAHNQRSTLLL
jgi:hypothetical protein